MIEIYSEDRIKGVHELMHDLRTKDGIVSAAMQVEFFKNFLQTIKEESIEALLRRIKNENNPLWLWVVHLRLDSLDVPPCLRTPYRDDTDQIEFITWLADLLWIRKRYGNNKVQYPSWQKFYVHDYGSDEWNAKVVWMYQRGIRGAAHYSKGLGLADRQKLPLAVLISTEMRGCRASLKSLSKYAEEIEAHARKHPDRSGAVKTEDTIKRRVEILRLYLLAAKSSTRTAEYYKLIHGEEIKRQAVEKQLEIIRRAVSARKL